MNAVPQLTRGDLAEATAKALQRCRDLNYPRAIMDELRKDNLHPEKIGYANFGRAIETERLRRSTVVAEIEREKV